MDCGEPRIARHLEDTLPTNGENWTQVHSARRFCSDPFLLAFALAAMMAAYQLNKPPQVYWHFDTDSYTWRPTLPWLYEAWGEKKRG